jgi:MtN3 and saliva related transmembrane protein
MNSTDWIGYVAATLTTISFVPQVRLIWRTRAVEGISLGMYAVFTTGITLWLAYGLMMRAWPLILANSITLLLALTILVLKLKYGRPPSR